MWSDDVSNGIVIVHLGTSSLTACPAEDHWVRPNEFIPERWYSRPELIKNKNAFVPFSIGTPLLPLHEQVQVISRVCLSLSEHSLQLCHYLHPSSQSESFPVLPFTRYYALLVLLLAGFLSSLLWCIYRRPCASHHHSCAYSPHFRLRTSMWVIDWWELLRPLRVHRQATRPDGTSRRYVFTRPPLWRPLCARWGRFVANQQVGRRFHPSDGGLESYIWRKTTYVEGADANGTKCGFSYGVGRERRRRKVYCPGLMLFSSWNIEVFFMSRLWTAGRHATNVRIQDRKATGEGMC